MSMYESFRQNMPPASNYDNSYYDQQQTPRSTHHHTNHDRVRRSAEYLPSDYARTDAGSERVPPVDPGYASRAPTEPPAGEEQYQLAPYDDEKAYAEYSMVYGPPTPEFVDPPPPRERRRARHHESRIPYDKPRVRYSDEGSDDTMTYDRHGRPYEETSLERGSVYDDDYDSRYDSPTRTSPNEDEKSGLKSSLIGGASGAYLGNRLVGKGALGTLGGAVAGAIGVNAMEHFDGKRHRKREEKERRRRVDTMADEAMEDAAHRRHRRREYYPEHYAPAGSDYDERHPPRDVYGDRRRRRPRHRARSLSARGY